jgi:hypothetical protein
MEVQISNYTDLLTFIKRDDISVENASLLVKKTLKVFSPYELTKDELIKQTEIFINKYCLNDQERPLFLGANVPFDIKDIYTPLK